MICSEAGILCTGNMAENMMKMDIRDVGDHYELDIDLPGFKKEEIKAQLENGYLTIRASKGLDKDEKDKKGQYIRRERSYIETCSIHGLCRENITILMKANENGILQLSIPKKEPQKEESKKYIAIEGHEKGTPGRDRENPGVIRVWPGISFMCALAKETMFSGGNTLMTNLHPT